VRSCSVDTARAILPSSVHTRSLVSAVPLLALVASAAPARAWFCSPDDTPEAEARRTALFSQFKDNYFITGWPLGPGTTTDPAKYVKFQFSIKFNLVPTRSRCTVFFAFTQRSFWKLWQKSPGFEDSNYNPAFFLAWRNHDFTSFLPSQPRGLRWLGVFAGYEHESNGKSAPDSIGWDRASAFTRVGYYFGDGLLGGGWQVIAQPKIWYAHIPEESPPDMLDYLGYGQLSLEIGRDGINHDLAERPGDPQYVYRDFVVGALVRPGKHFDRGYLEAWARFRPVRIPQVSFSIFAQFAMGYGETLARYNDKLPPTVRVGFAFDDRISTEAVTAAAQPLRSP
jgi:outer membrane phospholipase A